MIFEGINETVNKTHIHLRGLSQYGYGRVGMAQLGS